MRFVQASRRFAPQLAELLHPQGGFSEVFGKVSHTQGIVKTTRRGDTELQMHLRQAQLLSSEAECYLVGSRGH